jgi:hypothetical protein
LTSAKADLRQNGPLPLSISENMLSLSFLNWRHRNDQTLWKGMVFLLSSSQWRTRWTSASEIEVLRMKAIQHQLGEKERWLVLPQISVFFFLCVSWVNYILVFQKSLSMIHFGLCGTQSCTYQPQTPGFSNTANNQVTGIRCMSLSLRPMVQPAYHTLSAVCLPDTGLTVCVLVCSTHMPLRCFLISPVSSKVTSFKH